MVAPLPFAPVPEPDGRAAAAASRAVRITSTGGRSPVMSSTWRTAWCRSMSRPEATAPPADAQAAASGVGQGS